MHWVCLFGGGGHAPESAEPQSQPFVDVLEYKTYMHRCMKEAINMAKRTARHTRSAASLLVSGAATITLDQRIRVPAEGSTRKALEGDWDAIRSDYRRALMRVRRELVDA